MAIKLAYGTASFQLLNSGKDRGQQKLHKTILKKDSGIRGSCSLWTGGVYWALLAHKKGIG
jgi:hypothetical protein